MADNSFSKGCNFTCGVLCALIAIPVIAIVLGCGGLGTILKQVDDVRQEVNQRPPPAQRN